MSWIPASGSQRRAGRHDRVHDPAGGLEDVAVRLAALVAEDPAAFGIRGVASDPGQFERLRVQQVGVRAPGEHNRVGGRRLVEEPAIGDLVVRPVHPGEPAADPLAGVAALGLGREGGEELLRLGRGSRPLRKPGHEPVPPRLEGAPGTEVDVVVVEPGEHHAALEVHLQLGAAREGVADLRLRPDRRESASHHRERLDDAEVVVHGDDDRVPVDRVGGRSGGTAPGGESDPEDRGGESESWLAHDGVTTEPTRSGFRRRRQTSRFGDQPGRSTIAPVMAGGASAASQAMTRAASSGVERGFAVGMSVR